ncbi:MAG: Nramp family divalent metal transporter [Prolixibacteraceae bacterium]|jgi:manganese transport protein|nr:Nramp family divalent metal transporter [Prolixibacteraceae bacterium]MBT6004436.1 Nramp family divalent metal transporter [Prolixibacteraceae bacterium]MBT6766791.1 Nramp family divalent metal transporter [Prolixibacteraceae bacterium]MBT7000510.1 Nramp family divalent metal transporter [Prolixibacteraceae bacterium]MBT7395746.1 Nramp family divalent metal transporter [Prolixibacteraceae bacterium]
MSVKKRILNILFWSVVSAAFIGPGTITTAAKSGAAFGTELLWALVFSTFACLLLQEAAARLTIISGKNLGQAIVQQFEKSKSKLLVLVLVLGAIVLGAAAYEMGNLLGAVAGFRLIFNVPPYILVLIIGAVSAIILNIPSLKIIATIMGLVVVLMGLGFLITAFLVQPSFSEIAKGAFIPRIPSSANAGILVLGLIGTTIVPYNLFLGSGISNKNQSVKEMRFGLVVAILLGGLFSMAVLIVGTTVVTEFSFDELALALQEKIGPSGKYLLGFGLFAAGFTSAVTAPLAAAITIKSLFGNKNPEKWKPDSINYKLGWIFVLITGVGFAIGNVKPIPAIILAQALNGFLLPFISIFLFLVINNREITKNNTNPFMLNIAMIFVIFVTLVLGLNSASKAFFSTFFQGVAPENTLIGITLIALFLSIFVWVKAKKPSKNI